MNLIDRDKLIMHIADCQLSESITWEAAELITDFLLNSPVIKIQKITSTESRPKGEWKHLGETIRAVTLEMHQCSECGYVVLTRSEFNQESYCPHCGADMRGEE